MEDSFTSISYVSGLTLSPEKMRDFDPKFKLLKNNEPIKTRQVITFRNLESSDYVVYFVVFHFDKKKSENFFVEVILSVVEATSKGLAKKKFIEKTGLYIKKLKVLKIEDIERVD